MEIIARLGSLLGLSFISGVNLYATVAIVGLCLKHGLVQGLPPELYALASDAVIFVALVLYFVEFVVDKIPGLDTLWDTLHTIVRPLGGALLAVMQVGEGSPALEVIVFMIGASLASATHLTKAGTRLLVQLSPEPFSTMILSFGEDILAIGYTYLTLRHPRWSFFLTILLVAGVAVSLPILFRTASLAIRGVGYRILSAFGVGLSRNCPLDLPFPVQSAYEGLREEGEEILWAGKVFAVKLPGVPRYAPVYMVLSDRAATFFYRRFFHRRHKTLPKAEISRTAVYPRKLLSLCVFYHACVPWTVGVYRSLERTLPSLWFSGIS